MADLVLNLYFIADKFWNHWFGGEGGDYRSICCLCFPGRFSYGKIILGMRETFRGSVTKLS